MRLRHLILLEAQITSFDEWKDREIRRLEAAEREPDTQPDESRIRWFERELENRFQHIKDWFEAREIPLPTLQSYTLERAEKKAQDWVRLSQDQAKQDLFKQQKAVNTKTVFEDSHWRVETPVDPRAARVLAMNTHWCTINESTAAGYMRQGPLYVVTDKTYNPAEHTPEACHNCRKTHEASWYGRYQFHPATDQYMDVEDRRVKSLKPFESFLPKILVDDGSTRSFQTVLTEYPKYTQAFIKKNVKNEDAAKYMNTALSAKNLEAYRMLKDMGAPIPDNVFQYMKEDFFLPDEDMRYLISGNTDMTAGDYAPFRYAIKAGDSALLKNVISQYTKYQNEHHKNPSLHEPMKYAVQKNALESMKVILADPSFKDTGIIKVAAKEDKPEAAQLLIQYQNVDPTIDDNEALKFALGMRKEDVANVLMSDPRVMKKMEEQGLLKKYEESGWIKREGDRWVSALVAVKKKPAKKKKAAV